MGSIGFSSLIPMMGNCHGSIISDICVFFRHMGQCVWFIDMKDSPSHSLLQCSQIHFFKCVWAVESGSVPPSSGMKCAIVGWFLHIVQFLPNGLVVLGRFAAIVPVWLHFHVLFSMFSVFHAPHQRHENFWVTDWPG